jgi:hypothetical protein
MRISMAADAGLRAGLGMHAVMQRSRLVRMTLLAVHRYRRLRMREILDRGMAVCATQSAMDARMKGVRINSHAVARRILHRLVAMAGQAIRLCWQQARETKHKNNCGKA